MKNKIYNSLKKGYKINVGQDIADRVRTFVFNEGWDKFDNEAVENILESVMKNYFIITNLQENEYIQEDIEELKQLIIEKIHIAFEKFSTQEATPSQIYYYVSLCNELDEECQQIKVNKEIHTEISRLIKLKEEKEAKEQQALEEH